jgi:ABC-type glycerol-3-phosphate transport system substrate-binding protein
MPTSISPKLFSGLINNFTYKGETEDGQKALYAIPQGAGVRGLFVNKTLLQACGISEAPVTKSALLSACDTLKSQGFIPLQGNPATFAQHFLYPTICNTIANAPDVEATYNQVNSHQAGVSELFREPLQFLYDLVANRQYDYKTSETDRGLFKNGTLDTAVKLLLNINGDDKYPNGQVAFWPGFSQTRTQSTNTKIFIAVPSITSSSWLRRRKKADALIFLRLMAWRPIKIRSISIS